MTNEKPSRNIERLDGRIKTHDQHNARISGNPFGPYRAIGACPGDFSTDDFGNGREVMHLNKQFSDATTAWHNAKFIAKLLPGPKDADAYMTTYIGAMSGTLSPRFMRLRDWSPAIDMALDDAEIDSEMLAKTG